MSTATAIPDGACRHVPGRLAVRLAVSRRPLAARGAPMNVIGDRLGRPLGHGAGASVAAHLGVIHEAHGRLIDVTAALSAGAGDGREPAEVLA
ncbi:MAG: hypothetical protein ACYC65_05915 [Candidatus Limnocylindrales bacterium]